MFNNEIILIFTENLQQIAEFGTNHIYNCDTFNEMVPSNGDLDYLRRISAGIYTAMTDVDPQAIW